MMLLLENLDGLMGEERGDMELHQGTLLVIHCIWAGLMKDDFMIIQELRSARDRS